MIGRSGERGSGISVLAARHDDDDSFTCVTGIHARHSMTVLEKKDFQGVVKAMRA